ncbi:MAG TPA: adenine deaminase [Candidatus Desulfofervidus auxilii]|uniref:Adenine deaminase n=1 Tax=Desulfofervidus auxilii TaxID=1621989 RepID=A0A7V0IAF4_DESA2|nr:adenine deaminase [Candidatus Desulfofervidus auxilii]
MELILEKLAHIVAVARGNKAADLLIKDAKVVNVFSGEIYKAHVAIVSGYIAGIGNYKKGKQLINAKGRYLIPGLMDAHIHLESTLLTPSALAKVIIPHGTTSIFIDPHEIANVLGLKGIEYILRASENLPLNVFVLAPSCVPATHLETSGAKLDVKDIAQLFENPRIIGLAEMMNFPGVINGEKDVLEKIIVAKKANKVIDGHAPLLKGMNLQAYISTGIDADHETIDISEAKEKLQAGMWLMLREGTAAKNLINLLPIINAFNVHHFLLCCDDKEPADLLKEGHIDHLIRLAIKAGINPIWAIKMATINCAERFGLKQLGAIAPGYKADLVLINDLNKFQVEIVIKDGEIVFEEGVLKTPLLPYVEPEVTNTINIKEITPDMFKIKIKGKKARVIELVSDQILTKSLIMEVKKQGEEVLVDLERDIIKIAVIERHHATGNIGLGLVSGLGLKSGALASSVAHDSHNIIVAGVSENDMYVAVKAIKEMQGGFVVVENGMIKAGLSLPIAGLISPLSAKEVAFHIKALQKAAKELGVRLKNPFLTLSFVALPVIPQLRLTDKGLVDVNKFDFVPLEVE